MSPKPSDFQFSVSPDRECDRLSGEGMQLDKLNISESGMGATPSQFKQPRDSGNSNFTLNSNVDAVQMNSNKIKVKSMRNRIKVPMRPQSMHMGP